VHPRFQTVGKRHDRFKLRLRLSLRPDQSGAFSFRLHVLVWHVLPHRTMPIDIFLEGAIKRLLIYLDIRRNFVERIPYRSLHFQAEMVYKLIEFDLCHTARISRKHSRRFSFFRLPCPVHDFVQQNLQTCETCSSCLFENQQLPFSQRRLSFRIPLSPPFIFNGFHEPCTINPAKAIPFSMVRSDHVCDCGHAG